MLYATHMEPRLKAVRLTETAHRLLIRLAKQTGSSLTYHACSAIHSYWDRLKEEQRSKERGKRKTRR